LCAFRYHTTECVRSLFVRGMIENNAPSALPCYVPPVTHYLFLGTIGAADIFTPLTLCAFRYHTTECVRNLFVRGTIEKNAPSALPCYVPPVSHPLTRAEYWRGLEPPLNKSSVGERCPRSQLRVDQGCDLTRGHYGSKRAEDWTSLPATTEKLCYFGYNRDLSRSLLGWCEVAKIAATSGSRVASHHQDLHRTSGHC
jgi:hypothetical protein